MANELTITDISTYISQYKSQGSIVKSVTGIAANGTSTEAAAAPGASTRIVLQKLVVDIDTAGETLLIEDGDGTDLLTLRFPVADTYVFNNLNLEVTVNKSLKLDKGTVAALRGFIVYRPIKAGDAVAGA